MFNGSKTPPSVQPDFDYKLITGESLSQALTKDEVKLSKETLGGEQSALIQLIWNNKKYLVIVQKKPNLSSAPDALELSKMLSQREFQHDSLIKFLAMDAQTGQKIIQQLWKKANTREFVHSSLYNELSEWQRYYRENQNNKKTLREAGKIVLAKELEVELDIMEKINICEVVEGLSLQKRLASELKHSLAELKLTDSDLIQSINCYQPIVEAVFHLNSLFGAHGDISGVNIIDGTLIDIGCTLKADKQGTATNIPKRDLGAPHYVAPELFLAKVNSATFTVVKIDSWGLAIILVQLLTKTILPNIFDLETTVQTEDDLKQQYRTLFDSKECPLDKKLLALLPASELGDKVKFLLTNALQINPKYRLSIAEFIFHMNYSSMQLDELITKNLVLAMRGRNISMVKEFWRILRSEKNLLMSKDNQILEIIEALVNSRDIDIISATILGLFSFENFYVLLNKKTKAEASILLDKLITSIYYLEAANSSKQPVIKKRFKEFVEKIILYMSEFKDIKPIWAEKEFYSLRKSLPFKEEKLTDASLQLRAIEFAIAADNQQFLSAHLDVIKLEHIINFINSAVKNSPKCLDKLVEYGFKISSNKSLVNLILENDPSLLKYLLPYISILLPVHINKQADQGNTWLHLVTQKLTDPCLVIFLIILGGDPRITNTKKQDCLFYLDAESGKEATSYEMIMQFLYLLNNKSSFSSAFSISLFSKAELDDKEISTIPPKNYSVYLNNLAKYLRNLIIAEANLGRDTGDRPALKGVSRNTHFYQISEIILIALQALAKLENTDSTLTDTAKCLSCLEFISSFKDQFASSPFIEKVHLVYKLLLASRSDEVLDEESKSASSLLFLKIAQKKGDAVIDLLKKSKCFSNNPLLLRKNDNPSKCAPLDYIVHAIKTEEKWCSNCGIESLLKNSVDLEDDTNLFDWYKYTRIECQVIYALARKQGGQTGAERGSTNRLLQYLFLNNISCNKELTAMCLDIDKGFYLCTTEEENNKIKQLIKPGMNIWQMHGHQLMNYFNKSFETENFTKECKHQDIALLEKLITHFRDCVYDALVLDPEYYLENFVRLIKEISIPEQINFMSKFLEIFLDDLTQKKHLIKEEISNHSTLLLQ